MRLLIYDTERETANAYLPRAIYKAAQGMLGECNAHLCDHSEVVNLAGSGEWDGLLAIGGAGADPHLLGALVQTGIPRVLWTTEDPYERRLIEQAEMAFEHVFSNDHTCNGVTPTTSFLPLAAEPSVHLRPVRDLDIDYRYDLTFVGTAWPNRVTSLQGLLSALPSGLRIHLALPWNRHIPEPKLNGIGVMPRQRLDIGDLCDIWNESRVVLIIGREFSVGSQRMAEIVGSSPPPRVYETALAGGFQVALQARGMNLEKAYGEMIPTAENENDAAGLIMQHLRNPKERIIATQEIQEYTLNHHTYEKRLTRILNVLKKIQAKQKRTPIFAQPKTAGILHVSHNLVGLGLRRPGGTEAYVDSLAREQRIQKPERSVFAIAPKDPIRLGLLDYSSGRPQLKSSMRVGSIDPFAASQLRYERAFSRVIREEGIGIVHIHHLIGWPLGLPIIARGLGCRVVITLHDYYFACHRYTLQLPDGQFCGIDQAADPELRCKICLRTEGLDGFERNRRMALARKSLEASDAVIASTQTSADIMARIFPELAHKISVIEMLTPQLIRQNIGPDYREIGERYIERHKLRVGLIGNQVPHKGLDTLIKVLHAATELPFEFIILGATKEFSQRLNETWHDRNGPTIGRQQGAYGRKELLDVLKDIDVALFLSTWPETYNISMGEAMSQGAIPIATAIGAHQDRVKHMQNGILVPPSDPEAVVKALLQLHADPSLAQQLRLEALKTPLVSSADHAQALEQIYESLNPSQILSNSNLPSIGLADQIDLRMMGIRIANDSLDQPGVNWDDAI
jgi:glycosyltransferase involved in cell wall biosynthesis/spore maturation protein CgeB